MSHRICCRNFTREYLLNPTISSKSQEKDRHKDNKQIISNSTNSTC